MLFEQKTFDILDLQITPDMLEGMTRFPSFYEPFLRLGKDAERELRGKTLGERVAMPNAIYYITEKIDGANCQIIGWGDEMVIRSRTVLGAYSRGWLRQDKDDMVGTLQPHLENIQELMRPLYPDRMWLLGAELYGSGVGKQGQRYRSDKNVRLFSSRAFDRDALRLFVETPREQYDNLRRINEHVPYAKFPVVSRIAEECGLSTVPKFGTIRGDDLQTPEDAMQLLAKYRSSQTAKEDGGRIQSEGLVLWSQEDYVHPKEGKVMAVYKIKFKDYPQF